MYQHEDFLFYIGDISSICGEGQKIYLFTCALGIIVVCLSVGLYLAAYKKQFLKHFQPILSLEALSSKRDVEFKITKKLSFLLQIVVYYSSLLSC